MLTTRSQPEGPLDSTQPDSTPHWGLGRSSRLLFVPLRIMLLLASALLLPAMLGWSPMTSPSPMRSRMASITIKAPPRCAGYLTPTTPKFRFVISLRYPPYFAKISLNFNPRRMQKISGEPRRYTVTTLIGLTYLLTAASIHLSILHGACYGAACMTPAWI